MTFDSNKLMTTLEREHWINYYPVLPNSDVIDILYKSDILLFPSFDESLGWVLVEAGLAGIPRISTNIYAVPELIAHKVDGWMIDLPLNEDLRWIGIQQQNALEEYEKAKCIIKKGIIDIMGNSSMSIDKLHNMGVSAKKNISELYGFKQAQSKLEQIYNNATR
jgi:glycosyltransferase involved in cell wall biosynthesis